MNRAQAAAYIDGQILIQRIKLETFLAENRQAELDGCNLIHTETSFNILLQETEACVGHNAVIEFFNQHAYYHDN
jgi:hypothetical protein